MGHLMNKRLCKPVKQNCKTDHRRQWLEFSLVQTMPTEKVYEVTLERRNWSNTSAKSWCKVC